MTISLSLSLVLSRSLFLFSLFPFYVRPWLNLRSSEGHRHRAATNTTPSIADSRARACTKALILRFYTSILSNLHPQRSRTRNRTRILDAGPKARDVVARTAAPNSFTCTKNLPPLTHTHTPFSCAVVHPHRSRGRMRWSLVVGRTRNRSPFLPLRHLNETRRLTSPNYLHHQGL